MTLFASKFDALSNLDLWTLRSTTFYRKGAHGIPKETQTNQQEHQKNHPRLQDMKETRLGHFSNSLGTFSRPTRGGGRRQRMRPPCKLQTVPKESRKTQRVFLFLEVSDVSIDATFSLCWDSSGDTVIPIEEAFQPMLAPA